MAEELDGIISQEQQTLVRIIERDQDAYMLLMRAHDRVWASRSKLSLVERINTCATFWSLMLWLREDSDKIVAASIDESEVGI